MPLTMVRNGFLLAPDPRSESIYVDDGLPSGVTQSDDEPWDWGEYDLPPSDLLAPPAKAHRSKYETRYHFHSFSQDPSGLAFAAGDYVVQYLFIPEERYPAEVWLRYRDKSSGVWGAGAYWGILENLICLDDFDGDPASCVANWMGELEVPPGRWLALIARADDVGHTGTAIDGVHYSLYGGQAAGTSRSVDIPSQDRSESRACRPHPPHL